MKTKKFTFGKVAYSGKNKSNLVEIEISLKTISGELPVFTASGSIWDAKHYDIEMGGQCLDSIYKDFKNDIKDLPLYRKILGLWERNHLNDTNAGTPEQTAEIKRWEKQGNTYDYTKACEHLKSVGMYEVVFNGQPYKYGHGCIYRAISKEDLQEINELLAD